MTNQVNQAIVLCMVDAEKIRELRQARRLSTRKFAREASISTETLHAIEHGRRQPSMATLDKIAKALEVEVKDLLA